MTASELGRLLPEIRVPPPGPASRALARRLRRVESRNVTYLGEDFPVFWEEARGANVRDADGNVYVDLTGAFGVALLGHGRPEIESAVADQMGRLVHGMGDVHPPVRKVELLEAFARLLPWPDARTVLTTGGAEAVEVALKTALLATGRPGVVSFRGGYHGLTEGALVATARSDFRDPFRARIYDGTVFLPFPTDGDRSESAEAVLERFDRVLAEGAPNGDAVGAVIVEPIQARGGLRIPSHGFLAELGARARRAGVVVVADEIFTGLGRTGVLWASVRDGLEPDLICAGKALGGGFPLYACTGPARVMDAWPESEGEAIHTSTFLGHPASCAAGVAFLELLESEGLPARAVELGERMRAALTREVSDIPGVVEVRGRGLMQGVELGGIEAGDDGDGEEDEASAEGPAAAGLGAGVAARALEEGVLVLPAGDDGNVVELTPPAVLTDEQLDHAVGVLGRAIRAVAGVSPSLLLVLMALAFGGVPGAMAQDSLRADAEEVADTQHVAGMQEAAVAREAGPVPVLLVPGWADGPEELGALRTRFIEAGWPPGHVASLAFADPVGSNRVHAIEVAEALRELARATGRDTVDVVAHSMGGLALREHMRSPGGVEGVSTDDRSRDTPPAEPALRRIAFLATPHHGTVAAFIARGAGGDEMRPGSPFLEALNADSIPPADTEFLSIRTPVDLSVVPNESADFFEAENVRNVEVCCPSHSGLLDDEETFRRVVEFLRSQEP